MKGDLRHQLGARAEDEAASLYERRGFSILERNVRVGRLEIDLVAQKGNLIALVEVRSRSATSAVHPAYTIRGQKAEHMRRAARAWLASRATRGASIRIDVVAATALEGGAFQLDVYENVLSG